MASWSEFSWKQGKSTGLDIGCNVELKHRGRVADAVTKKQVHVPGGLTYQETVSFHNSILQINSYLKILPLCV